MNCLIVGYGSIGRRHASVLAELGCLVSLVTNQVVDHYKCYQTVEHALSENPIEYIVIANPTHVHSTTLLSLITAGYEGIVLVEKPLSAQYELLPENKISNILVGYNLRFCDLLQTAKKLIEDDRIISFTANVGQYLPTWRKNTDYRECYSAKKESGGGVLRDLSHELDYTIWFCGPCENMTALGGRYSNLEISSDDIFSIVMQCTSCPNVNLHLNYLDRGFKREIVINTDKHTISIDLIKGCLIVDGELRMSGADFITQTYIQQHKAVLKGEFDIFCQYTDGMYLVRLIEAIEHANNVREWVTVCQ